MIEHEGTMYAVLKKYGLYNKREDYIDLCYIGYAKALNKFDKSKANIRTYIYKCVENEILQELRKEKAQKRQRYELSMDYIYDESGHDLGDIIQNDIDLENDLLCKENSSELYKAIDNLNENERFIIRSLYGIGEILKTQADLSEELHISREEIKKAKESILQKLGEMIKDER